MFKNGFENVFEDCIYFISSFTKKNVILVKRLLEAAK